MPRKPRIHFPGAVYHVMLRGNAGQDIFIDDEDRTQLSLLMQQCVERFNCRIHAFCLMSNHVHLAIQVGTIPLSRFMQSLNLQFTRHYNRKQGVTGHLFQGRYKAILVSADDYLLELVRYIHLNPVRIALVDNPEDYRWSSHKAYCGQASLPWLTTDWVFTFFAETGEAAVSRFRNFVMDGIGEGYRKEFHKGNQEGRLLGDDDFADEAMRKSGQSRMRQVSLEEIMEVVCDSYSIPCTDLGRPGKDRVLAEARAVVACLIRDSEHLSVTEFGRLVGRDVSSLCQGITRLLKRAESDAELKDKMQQAQLRLEYP